MNKNSVSAGKEHRAVPSSESAIISELKADLSRSRAMRDVLLSAPALDADQMLRVDRGREPVPLDWPSNWGYLFLIHQITNMVESHEWQIDHYIKSAAKARILFDSGAVYATQTTVTSEASAPTQPD